MVRKHQARNLEIPGSMLSHRPGMTFGQIGRRTTQIRIRPTTAEPMPTARRILSGIDSALFIARRIQTGPAANINPSNTNSRAIPMRKSANARDLIGRQPPRLILFLGFAGDEAIASPRPCQLDNVAEFARFKASARPPRRPAAPQAWPRG